MLSKKYYLIIVVLLLVTAGLLLGGRGLTGEKPVTASSEADPILYMPLVMQQFDPRFANSPFGVQIYGRSDADSQYHPYLIGSQAKWVRSRVHWALVEPNDREPAQYGWAWADLSLAAGDKDQGGLSVIAVIEDVPEWARLIASYRDGPIHPAALDDFVDFVQATVERYDGDGIDDAPGQPVVHFWELFNEPDSTTNRWGGYGTEYAQMLSLAYPAIKAANPYAQVLFGGVAYDWFVGEGGPFDPDFLDDVFTAGGGPYFDVMNFHLYPSFAIRWGSESTGLVEKTAAIRAKLGTYGLDKPVMVTEAGWHSSPDIEPTSNNQMQIARLVQMNTQALAADIDVIIWWMLYDPGGFSADFGLVTNDPVPVTKPSYTAYQNAVFMLGDSSFVKKLSVGETGLATMEAFKLRNRVGDLYVAWINPYDTNDTHTLRVAAQEVIVYDGQGNSLGTLTDGNGDGLVGVNITDQPVYIQVTR